MASLRRITAMDRHEIRFRAQCELRKSAGRLHAAVAPPRWRRTKLLGALRTGSTTSPAWACALDGLRHGDFRAAHAAFAAHFSTRRSVFPLGAASVPVVAGAIRQDFPEAAAEAVRRADSVNQGRYDLLGYRGLELGAQPDWHYDPVHNRRSPRVFWADVPYLDPATGDHKLIWELNRHQHWLLFGRAHALSGEHRFYTHFTSQLASWLSANPPLLGTNWASMLELAFRSLTWLWALELFAPGAADDPEPWIVDMLLALDRQLTHIEHNLSRYFSPNTHLSGEALALYVAGQVLPELRASRRRSSIGREVLAQEATRQVRSDGGHVELSAHYHRYSTDFYLLATTVATRAEDPAAPILQEAARRQARYLRTITDDRGVLPQIGDDDGGVLFPICGRPPEDCRDTLATAAVMLMEPALAVAEAPEETYWMCGPAARGALPKTVAPWPSAALPASGYFVSRTTRGDRLIFDAGPHGFLNGGHAHADALSCVLTVAGHPLLIDPGTATYTMDPETRDRFRSTMMHNTVVLDDRSQSEPRGAFHWESATSAHALIWRSGNGCDYVEGTHDGYAPHRHARGILSIHGVGWCFLDHLLGSGSPRVDSYWHVHPSWHCTPDGDQVIRLHDEARTLALASTAPLTLLPAGQHRYAMRSPAYGVVEPAPVACARTRTALPTTIGTFIPAMEAIAERLTIEPMRVGVPPGAGWHGCAFRVRWSGGVIVLLAAIEDRSVALSETSPAGRWGTAGLQTDARVAAVIEYASGHSEAVLINGAFLHAPSMDQVISLPERAPLLRIASPEVASSMHEVGLALE